MRKVLTLALMLLSGMVVCAQYEGVADSLAVDSAYYNDTVEFFAPKKNPIYYFGSPFCEHFCELRYTSGPDGFGLGALFFKLINEYNYDRGSFSNFMEYTFSHRLTSKVQSVAFAYQNQIAAIGSNNDFQTIETLADPTQRTIQEEIALKNFKTRISSPNRNKKLVDRTMDKILAMQYAGLSTKEICERLNLSPARYRNYIKKIQDDDRVINFKLEMK